MSNFHAQKAKSKADKKFTYTQRALDAWKAQERVKIHNEIAEEANRRIRAANEDLDRKYEKNKAAIKQEALDQAFALMIGIPVRVLKIEYGWGRRKRLPEFAEYVQKYYQEFSDGGMSLRDYQRLVWEETGTGFILREQDETVDQAAQRFDSWVRSEQQE